MLSAREIGAALEAAERAASMLGSYPAVLQTLDIDPEAAAAAAAARVEAQWLTGPQTEIRQTTWLDGLLVGLLLAGLVPEKGDA